MRCGMRYVIIIGLICVWGCNRKEVKRTSSPRRNFRPVIAKAREFYKSGESEQAMEIANGILQIDPENPLIYELKGEILFDIGDYREAIANFKKAENLDPRLFSAYFKEGFAHNSLHEEKEMIDCLRKGIEIFRALPPEKELSEDILSLIEEAARTMFRLLPPVKVAVLHFGGDIEATAQNYNRLISGLLIQNLAKQQRILVKDPRTQSKFLEKYSLGMLAKPDESLRIGKLLNVDWIVMGTVYKSDDSFQIDLKMLKVATGTIVYKDIISFSSHKEIETRCEEIVDKIVIHTI